MGSREFLVYSKEGRKGETKEQRGNGTNREQTVWW